MTLHVLLDKVISLSSSIGLPPDRQTSEELFSLCCPDFWQTLERGALVINIRKW
jgi:hypothetical protein